MSAKTVGSAVQVMPHKGNAAFLSDPGFRSTEFGDQGQGDPAYGDRSIYPGIVHAVRTDGTLDVVVFDQNAHGRMFRGLKFIESDADAKKHEEENSKGIYCRDLQDTTPPPVDRPDSVSQAQSVDKTPARSAAETSILAGSSTGKSGPASSSTPAGGGVAGSTASPL